MAYISFQPSDYFNTKLYTGTGSSNAITGVGFQPDWVWIKNRGNTESHALFDSVRGVTKRLHSNGTGAEETNTNTLTAFGTDGFTVGTNAGVNGSGISTVAWNWKANGSGSANTDGQLTSTVSANTTSGFSIGTYTSDITSAGYKTVGHGLGKTPKLIITKNLGVAGQRWGVQAPGLLSGDSYILQFNDTTAEDNQSGNGSLATVNSTVFSVNWAEGLGNANSGGNYVFYAFTDIKGFSKFGSYTGNGSTDGVFVYTGMSPAFIMVKRTNTTEGWYMYDVKRDTFNVSDAYLTANTSNAEATLTNGLDILSNGFKMRNTDTGHNASGSTYIYMCFAESPIVSSNDIPATAR